MARGKKIVKKGAAKKAMARKAKGGKKVKKGSTK